ncbi:MAG: ATPase [Deltaproteobacteria bacterium CG11_big_fil_rev_8_21_14_0_20_45_16]|nr:MAG: ATPase [Deltaproteobacteria bacterium CG11_big_fil_rev_8_21_14_0_20_45_16]
MIHRILEPSTSRSFFLFGARATGKTTFLSHQWGHGHHYINLLLDSWESRYFRNPDQLIDDLKSLKHKPRWIVIDEIQKIPKLLDTVHQLIETTDFKFVLTGSSARKLKRGAANLLAGRAFHYEMFPLTHRELDKDFDLQNVLEWGSLPNLLSLKNADRLEYLYAYTKTYLKEEILQEQVVRQAGPFRMFLEVAAQMNGKLLNFAKMARGLGVDTKTVQSYFQALEDTLIGKMLPAYTKSARKSVMKQPKFYLFDLGVKRAMDASLGNKISQKTSAYGEAFEHFIVLEAIRLNSYCRKHYSIFHYQTSAGGEVDLVLQKARQTIAVEVKSTERIDRAEVQLLERSASALSPQAIYYLSRDPVASKIGKVYCLHWQDFFKEVF